MGIRQSDPLLKFQPVLQLHEPSGPKLIKVGANSLSIHVVGTRNYIGWTNLYPLLASSVWLLFDRIQVREVSRIGLRYINVLTTSRHKVSGIQDLRLNLQLRGEAVKTPFSMSCVEENSATMIGVTRIASPELVDGPLPEDAAAVVDVGVATSEGTEFSAAEGVCEWIQLAHDFEKQLFFSLIPEGILRELVDEH